MLMSMTGFGEAWQECPELRVGFRLRSVNHKGLDLNLRLPTELAYLENCLRGKISSRLLRGRVDLYAEIEWFEPSWMPRSELNRVRLCQLLEMNRVLREEYHLQGDLTPADLLHFADLGVSRKVGYQLPKAGEELIQNTLDQALEKLAECRRVEGMELARALTELLDGVRLRVLEIQEMAASRPQEWRTQLQRRLAPLLGEIPLDENRLYQEWVFQLDRLDLTEEITRLLTHLQTFIRHLQQAPAGIGKELEFLAQEMQREASTLGNKARHADMADRVVAIKTQLEKIREQLLNIE
jgi:uncharacterized protein (TIGR00255 family)